MGISTCPTNNQLKELLSGQIRGLAAADLAEHIDFCAACTEAVQILAKSKPDSKKPLNQSVQSGTMCEPRTLLSLADIDETLFASTQEEDLLKFLSPPQKPDELGRIAHYRILKVLGVGGMGVVLHAEDTLLERSVALKAIKPEYMNDNNVRQRFLREARLMAALKSDHIVTIHQIGEDSGNCFIAMELLSGESLDYLIARVERPTLGESLRIIREVAQALDVAHTRGLIHRDIKPENIWLESPTGRVKLLDFGLARPQIVNVKLTTSGMIMGTPAYMAPEQARAEEVNERTDLFSLGCILYQMICGELPFAGETVWEILYALNEKDPKPVTDFWPGVPDSLNELLMQLLKKNPAERPQTASEVIERLLIIEGSLSDGDGPLLSVKKVQGSPASIYQKNRSNVGSTKTGTHKPRTPESNEPQLSQMIQRDAERRQVTVLVCNCNLFESESFFDQIDVEEQASINHAFQSACEESVRRFDGTLIHCNDDGLLACFGFPVAYEDAAVRAANAALTLRELLNLIADELKQKHALELSPWLGIHTGLAIAQSKETGISLVGEARNLALRLKEVSKPGQIVCSQTTHLLLRGRFDCSSLGAHKFRSVTEPIDLFDVKSQIEGSSPVEVASPVELSPLTGRDVEMSLLKDRWEQAKEGIGQVVTLTGEAGLGKSRLVHALKQLVYEDMDGPLPVSCPYTSDSLQQGKHLPIVEWRCSPHFQNSVFYPAVSYFERLLHFERDISNEEAFQRLVEHLECYGLAQPDVVPILAGLLNLAGSDKYPSLGLAPVRERQELFRVLKEWLRAYSEKQPILFVIEDLHWLDATTLEFLGQFLAETAYNKILTLLTYRPEFHPSWATMPHLTAIGLNRLTKKQVGDLVKKKIGGNLPEGVVDQVYERAGGVPLFIEEFAKMVQDSGMLERANGAQFRSMMGREIPTTLQDLLMARLDHMEGDRELAQLVSTIGREFSFELISAVSGLDNATLCTNLAKLVQAEILFEKGRAPRSTYSFKHALLEDALYNAMVKSKRQQFHSRIAQILETRFPQVVATQPELLAHHFTEGGMSERSLNYWLAAGLRAQEQCANFEAINHLTKGLTLLETCVESEERDEIELMMLTPLGSIYQAALGYAAPDVGATFARARELCSRVGETPQLFSIMWGNWSWHLVKGELSLALELAEDMVTFAENVADIGILMEAYVAPACTLFYLGDFVGCRNWCDAAIEKHEDLENSRIWSTMTGQNSALHIRTYLMLALFHLGYPEQALKLHEELIAMAREIGHPFSLAHALHFSGWLLFNCRMGDRLYDSGKEETAIATEQGFALWESTGTFFMGAGLFLQGQLDEAIRLMEKGIRSFRAIGSYLTLPGQLGVLSEAYLRAGMLDKARVALDEGLELANGNSDRSRLAELQRLNGELILLESGDLAAAEQCFHDSVETACSQQSKCMALRATTSLARLWKQQGRVDEARKALSTVYEVYEEGFETEDLKRAQKLLNELGA